MAPGNVRPSHEVLQKKLLVSGYEVLHLVIDKDDLLHGSEIVLTVFRITIVNMIVTVHQVECTSMEHNIRV